MPLRLLLMPPPPLIQLLDAMRVCLKAARQEVFSGLSVMPPSARFKSSRHAPSYSVTSGSPGAYSHNAVGMCAALTDHRYSIYRHIPSRSPTKYAQCRYPHTFCRIIVSPPPFALPFFDTPHNVWSSRPATLGILRRLSPDRPARILHTIVKYTEGDARWVCFVAT